MLTYSGMFEAIIVPGISLILAGFYLKEEQPPRNALVFAAASSVFNGLISWAIGHISDNAPLAIWQYLYLLTGVCRNPTSSEGKANQVARRHYLHDLVDHLVYLAAGNTHGRILL